MQSVSVGELKSRFSEILERVREGEEIVISFGKQRTKAAVLVPYNRYAAKEERVLGPLANRGKCVIHEDFKLTDEGLLLT
ncbi:MAG: type II toxin-antitoxin system prevent-host-death family antitoxin [Deltaproteobacteria bacterium]|nr:type II toxin-antitoxin system prevent-host-death family antitoxin [Deltaproteobacteria bacterium]